MPFPDGWNIERLTYYSITYSYKIALLQQPVPHLHFPLALSLERDINVTATYGDISRNLNKRILDRRCWRHAEAFKTKFIKIDLEQKHP